MVVMATESAGRRRAPHFSSYLGRRQRHHSVSLPGDLDSAAEERRLYGKAVRESAVRVRGSGASRGGEAGVAAGRRGK